MSINSLDAFKKVCIENNYEPYDLEDSLKKVNDNQVAFISSNETSAANYFQDTQSFSFMIYRTNAFGIIGGMSIYDSILEEAKENCEYYKIITSENGNDYVSYSCSESLYKGKIGFRVEDKMGFIWNFPNE